MKTNKTLPSLGSLHPVLFFAVIYIVALFFSIFICSSLFYSCNTSNGKVGKNTTLGNKKQLNNEGKIAAFRWKVNKSGQAFNLSFLKIICIFLCEFENVELIFSMICIKGKLNQYLRGSRGTPQESFRPLDIYSYAISQNLRRNRLTEASRTNL